MKGCCDGKLKRIKGMGPEVAKEIYCELLGLITENLAAEEDIIRSVFIMTSAKRACNLADLTKHQIVVGHSTISASQYPEFDGTYFYSRLMGTNDKDINYGN
ncbi:hypothetical protein V492_02298 [Pseudogymnoascus sp. VKM F-4246]|nr:hypothetical protein V492_02298 [Pseudogymnoascus sp. VKM F-4246]